MICSDAEKQQFWQVSCLVSPSIVCIFDNFKITKTNPLKYPSKKYQKIPKKQHSGMIRAWLVNISFTFLIFLRPQKTDPLKYPSKQYLKIPETQHFGRVGARLVLLLFAFLIVGLSRRIEC